jgi:hypothetical protein
MAQTIRFCGRILITVGQANGATRRPFFVM